jgi:hypothetical protein
MLLESRICGYREGFWAATDRFQYGVPATHSMADDLVRAFASDIRIRQAAPDPLPAKGVGIDAKEIAQGEIYNGGLARVSAFLVDHQTMKPSVWISCRFCGSLCSHFGRHEVLPEPRGFRQGSGMPDSRCLECWLEAPHAVETINCIR